MATGVDAKLLKSTKFPPEFNQKVDMQKVNIQVMKKYVNPGGSSRHSPVAAHTATDQFSHRWIANQVTTILRNEDDVVIELIFNLIDGPRYVSDDPQLTFAVC